MVENKFSDPQNIENEYSGSTKFANPPPQNLMVVPLLVENLPSKKEGYKTLYEIKKRYLNIGYLGISIG